MILAMHAENTYITMGVVEKGEIRGVSRMAADRRKTESEYALAILGLLELKEVPAAAMKGGILSSVVPSMTGILRAAMELVTGSEPVVVGPGVKSGLNIMTDHPAALGSDLVVSAVGAIAAYPVPLIVADFGTAITFLAVNDRKQFVGSVIAAGVDVAAAALSSACDQLPRVALEQPGRVLGRNTADCIRSGALYGTACMTDGMIRRIEEELGSTCTVIARGARCPDILPLCRKEIIRDEDIMFRGLWEIWKRNRGE